MIPFAELEIMFNNLPCRYKIPAFSSHNVLILCHHEGLAMRWEAGTCLLPAWTSAVSIELMPPHHQGAPWFFLQALSRSPDVLCAAPRLSTGVFAQDRPHSALLKVRSQQSFSLLERKRNMKPERCFLQISCWLV